MLQKVIGKARRAIDDYNMIDDGDKIAVGLSGGKDSLTLLTALNDLRRFYPKKFELLAITIDPGVENFHTDKLEAYCKKLNIPYIVYKSDLAKVVFDIRNEKNPCSLCANMRRGMLNSIAVENGCTKIALGHHSDDVMETLLMSMFLNGKIHTFAPVTYLSRSDVKTIRPFIYVLEKEIKAVARDYNLPVMEKWCKKDGYTKREYTKDLIKTLRHDIPGIKDNLMGAIKRSNIDGWKINNDNNKQ